MLPPIGLPLLPIAICIPARNEEAELPALFTALDALDDVGLRPIDICLLLDACTDRSAALVQAYGAASRHRVSFTGAEPAAANAGRARHRAMEMGMAALSGRRGLLLTTDADSTPSPWWLRAMSAALQEADVVAGKITRRAERVCRAQDRLERYFDALFALRRQLDPVPWEAHDTHHYCGGANLGIRSEAYQSLGGFAPVASGEDALLIDDAARAGLRVRRDAACLVHTSDRRIGRAEGGLATALQLLDGSEDEATVAHPADAAWQYRRHAAARQAYDEDRMSAFALTIGLSADHARGVARDCPNAEAFAMRIVPVSPQGMRSVSLSRAETELALLADMRRAA